MKRYLTMKRRKSRRNVRSSSRRQRNSTPDSVDMFGSLPDSILSIILSCLPTKDAVATSVLSKRFQIMWRTVHNLEFFHLGRNEERFEGEDMNFVEFVNRVLLLHDSSLLKKFHLFWKPRCILSHANSWIKTAITKNVQDLLVCVESSAGPIEIPISVFSCDSLRFLELDGGISFSAEYEICLPRLESLKLFSVDFQSEEAFETLISGCPVLNFLLLHIDIDYMIDYFGRGYNFFSYMISSTSLRRLVVYVKNNEAQHEQNFFCSLALKTPSLEYLTIDGQLDQIYVIERLCSLVEVNFMISLHEDDFEEADICDAVVEVVRAFDCAKTLEFSFDAMWALNNAEISLSTEFKRLVKFVTICFCSHCCLLQDFIQSSDNLEDLIIYQGGQRTECHSHHSNWKAPIEVPKCLSNSLKKVELIDCYGYEDELDMIRYILKHGSVLEVIKIALDGNREDAVFELMQEICKFPRNSPACEVEVDQFIRVPVVTSSNSD